MVGETSEPQLTDEDFEELMAFITRSRRASKLVTYLHLEGKGKGKMEEEDIETKVQKKTREEEDER